MEVCARRAALAAGGLAIAVYSGPDEGASAMDCGKGCLEFHELVSRAVRIVPGAGGAILR